MGAHISGCELVGGVGWRQGTVACVRCGRLIDPRVDAWDRDHTDDRQGYPGPAHARCNRSAGAAVRVLGGSQLAGLVVDPRPPRPAVWPRAAQHFTPSTRVPRPATLARVARMSPCDRCPRHRTDDTVRTHRIASATGSVYAAHRKRVARSSRCPMTKLFAASLVAIALLVLPAVANAQPVAVLIVTPACTSEAPYAVDAHVENFEPNATFGLLVEYSTGGSSGTIIHTDDSGAGGVEPCSPPNHSPQQ